MDGELTPAFTFTAGGVGGMTGGVGEFRAAFTLVGCAGGTAAGKVVGDVGVTTSGSGEDTARTGAGTAGCVAVADGPEADCGIAGGVAALFAAGGPVDVAGAATV